MPIAQVIKRMWAYIKENMLQDPTNKQMIRCDEKLAKIVPTGKFRGFNLTKKLKKHMNIPEQISETKDDTPKATPRKPCWTAKQKKEVKARKKELNGKMKEEVKPSAEEYVELSSDDALLKIDIKEECGKKEVRKRKQEDSLSEFPPKMELKEEMKEELETSVRDLLESLSSAGGLKEEYSERETKRCKQEISLGNLEIKKESVINVKEEAKEITEGNLEIKKEFVINVKEEAEEITEEDSEPSSDARSVK